MPRRVPQIEILDADRLAFEAHTAVADQFSDDRDGLAGARQRLPIRDAMLGFDLHLVARPEPEDEPAAGNVGDRGGGHRDRGRGADENAADAGAEKDARGPHRACRQDRELVAAMPFGNPGRLVAEALGEVDEVDDLGRVEAARNGDADPAHPVLPVMEPPSNIVCHIRARRRDPMAGRAKNRLPAIEGQATHRWVPVLFRGALLPLSNDSVSSDHVLMSES
jgi:hypothetical protein